MQTSPMQGTGTQQSCLGGGGACCLTALLLWLSLQPLHAQVATPAPPDQSQSLENICGRTRFAAKLLSGQTANPERWPWQASLAYRGIHLCGAVLIDTMWVATAAHCFQLSKDPSDYRILLGYNQLSNPTNYSRQMTVNTLFIHEDYDKHHPQGSDIVLMQLHRPVEFNSHILPACVPNANISLPLDRPCWTSGWGRIHENTPLPKPMQLQEADLIIMENSICSNFFPPPPPGNGRHYQVKDDVLCAGDLATGKSVCPGDSGGPLVCPIRGIWYVVGLSSWSVPCLKPVTTPSVFTRVSYFYDWIIQHKTATPTPNPSTIPPEESAPALSPNSGTVLRPKLYRVLLSSQTLLLQVIWVRSL